MALEDARVETQEAKTRVGQLENQLKTALHGQGEQEGRMFLGCSHGCSSHAVTTHMRIDSYPRHAAAGAGAPPCGLLQRAAVTSPVW